VRVADVQLSGPLLTGNAGRIVVGIVEEIQDTIGQAASERVHYFLDASIQHPTPYYETQVTLQHIREDVVVHDRGIVYGPWLEGTSSRNRRTRFKGYGAFRRATSATQRQAPEIARRVIQASLGRLGGR
jgi:hypothetical protein